MDVDYTAKSVMVFDWELDSRSWRYNLSKEQVESLEVDDVRYFFRPRVEVNQQDNTVHIFTGQLRPGSDVEDQVS